jgi:predicted nucleic acid-binding protein
MRAVLDTNVLISGVIATGVPHELLIRRLDHEYQIVVSAETLTEPSSGPNVPTKPPKATRPFGPNDRPCTPD